MGIVPTDYLVLIFEGVFQLCCLSLCKNCIISNLISLNILQTANMALFKGVCRMKNLSRLLFSKILLTPEHLFVREQFLSLQHAGNRSFTQSIIEPFLLFFSSLNNIFFLILFNFFSLRFKSSQWSPHNDLPRFSSNEIPLLLAQRSLQVSSWTFAYLTFSNRFFLDQLLHYLWHAKWNFQLFYLLFG